MNVLQEDFSGCLHKLMRYPSVKDIKPFIPQALKLQKLPNAVGGQEVIRQNYVLEGKALPALPPVSDVDQGMHNQQQHSKRDGSPYARQASNHHDQSKNQTLVFSGNSGFVQHIPPAALDAIKPVAEGFVHATKNVLESKGGAALNKAIHDMRKNTQSYMRKANTPTSSASTSNFPPMFDQAISSNSRVIVPNQSANSSRSQVTNTSSSTSSGHGLDRQSQSQLGQIVAKALVVLEAEFTAHGRGNDDSKDNTPTETGDVAKAALKAKIAAFTGLEHVRDVLLGLSQEINPLVIESGMLESSTISVTNNKKLALSDSKPNIDQQSASPATMRRPANAVSASTKSGIPSSISSPVRSSFETSKEARPPSRSTSYTSGVLSVGSIEQEVPAPEVYIPAPPPLLPAKPFSFDDLIEDSVPNAKGSPLSSSPKGSGSSGVVSRVKSPRSSLAHSQFSWMLSDESVTSVASTVSSIAGQPSGTGGSNSSISQTLFSSTSPSPSQRMKIDPLAGSVSRRGGSGMSVASSGLTPISNQQNQDDDPLSL
ncbi:hypothetical protein BGZ76_006121 [Entomortierella beljakovae]|nr:hypothetical protein BGZ76_006121 [Entomortierella beljakovae]